MLTAIKVVVLGLIPVTKSPPTKMRGRKREARVDTKT